MVDYYFKIPDGSDYHDIFPKMGLSPEIGGQSGLVVAVYADGASLEHLTTGYFTPDPEGNGPKNSFDGVVCTVSQTGFPNVYSGVSRDGMALPPGTQQGPLPTP